MNDTFQSFFVIEEDKLADEEIEKLLSFCQCDLNASEKWEIEVLPNEKIVNGCCEGIDTGIFYLFLVGEKLDQKINIIRG